MATWWPVRKLDVELERSIARLPPRTQDALPNTPAFERTTILREAPAIGRIIQTDKGGRPSN